MADIFELFKKIDKNQQAPLKPEYIVAGLGNPGSEYETTRHNVGFMAVDYIATKFGAGIRKSKFKALTDTVMIVGHAVLLMKPQTFMNLSGEAIAQAASFYKIPPERIIVISDDICQEPGTIRIRRSGSAGGHNGLSNIISLLSSDKFPRVKIGVGDKPYPEYDLARWVLGRMSEKDIEHVESRFPDIYDAVCMILNDNLETAMGKYNCKPKNDRSE